VDLYESSVDVGRNFFGRLYNTPQHKIKNMKEDSGLEDLFEEDKELSPLTNEESISGSLTLAGNIFLWIGWIGLIATLIQSAVIESAFPLLIGIVALLSCWISSLIFKGLSKIIDLLGDIKNK
tara:strand:+ start:529 stop:897 length:369 start_codon:yes stop_codon:yes gene_type:complete